MPLPDIGLRTTKGVPRRAGHAVKTSFHQELIEQDCVACHSDHQGPKLTQRSRKPFSHALLRTAVARALRDLPHGAGGQRCTAQTQRQLRAVPQQERWKPATFDHAKLFVLDSDHNAACVTCHTDNDYSRYTCYGCHEHTPAKVRAEHQEEGIQNFENCVECHRSANKEAAERGSREGRKRD